MIFNTCKIWLWGNVAKAAFHLCISGQVSIFKAIWYCLDVQPSHSTSHNGLPDREFLWHEKHGKIPSKFCISADNICTKPYLFLCAFFWDFSLKFWREKLLNTLIFPSSFEGRNYLIQWWSRAALLIIVIPFKIPFPGLKVYFWLWERLCDQV